MAVSLPELQEPKRRTVASGIYLVLAPRRCRESVVTKIMIINITIKASDTPLLLFTLL